MTANAKDAAHEARRDSPWPRSRLPRLAARLVGAPIAGRASIRAATPDHLPLAGALGQGLFVLGGLASRGFTLAPSLAEHIAAVALGAPSPLPASLAAVVAPERFAERTRRRERLAARRE